MLVVANFATANIKLFLWIFSKNSKLFLWIFSKNGKLFLWIFSIFWQFICLDNFNFILLHTETKEFIYVL